MAEIITTSTSSIINGKILTFDLSNESYGIPVLKVLEIIRLQKITPVPHMPSYVRGVINLRGKVVPIIDMRERFNLKCDANSDKTCVIVVQILGEDKTISSVGIIVDAVDEVIHTKELELENTPDLGTSIDSSYILGIAKLNEKVKTLLDIDKVINEDKSLSSITKN